MKIIILIIKENWIEYGDNQTYIRQKGVGLVDFEYKMELQEHQLSKTNHTIQDSG